jgi:hypothetical protein
MGYQPATYKIAKKNGMYELREYDERWNEWWLKDIAFTYWGIKKALHKRTHEKPEKIIGYFNSEGNQLYE